jgi:acetoin utilization deacetylase AcuC-like enzyme
MRVVLDLWHSHHHPVPLPERHPFPAGKYAPLVGRLLADQVTDAAHLHASAPAPLEWLARAHDPEYVARVGRGELDDRERRELGLPWSPELVIRARAATFGTVSAARAALARGVAGNLAGGSHHAFRDRPGAFGLFNDLAVAIAVLRAEGQARRPFVLDLDVHHGNGTAAIHAGDPTVFTLSVHGARNVPGPRAAGSLDVALPDGCRNAEYLDALDAHVPAALDHHAPDLVLYQSGVDGLAADRFGRLALTHAGLAARDARVFAWCEARGLPVAVTLGGGYGAPLEASVEAHAAVMRAARASLVRRAGGAVASP